MTGLCISLGFGGYFVAKHHRDNLESKPKKYCYQTYFGPANSALCIENRNDWIKLVAYYDSLAIGKNPPLGFPLKTLPMKHPVHLLQYEMDGQIAKVVSTYNRGKRLGGSYLRCWVDARTLHDVPPNSD